MRRVLTAADGVAIERAAQGCWAQLAGVFSAFQRPKVKSLLAFDLRAAEPVVLRGILP